MKLYEFDENMPKGMYDATRDVVGKAKLTDTRKDVLTLGDLNRLKKLRAFRRLQDLKRQDTLTIIYGQGDGDSDSDF
jgi:hypothetical protein